MASNFTVDGPMVLSRSGAMVILSLIPNIWDRISLGLHGRGRIDGFVCWARDGQVGTNFSEPRE